MSAGEGRRERRVDNGGEKHAIDEEENEEIDIFDDFFKHRDEENELTFL